MKTLYFFSSDNWHKHKGVTGMKKVRWLICLSVLFLLTAVQIAEASTTSGPHGNFTSNTAGCATCHQTHTAPTTHLIKFTLAAGNQNAIYRICTYCHSSTGQSHYDEVDGQIKDSSGNLWANSAGGFQYMAAITGANSYATAQTITSKHKVDSSDGTLVSIPGGSTSTNGTIQLTCVSCHDPHGTSNSRLLVTSVTIYNAAGTGWTTTPTSVTPISITVNNPLAQESVTYNDDGITTFCGACHTDYYQTAAGSGETTSGTYTPGLYRHRMGMPASGASGFNAAYFVLPTPTTGDVTCLTCHYAHGTRANVSASTYANGSTLLRMDERGVCENCHRKTPSTTQPTVVSANSYETSDKTHIVLNFSSYMLSGPAQTTSNYTVSGGLSVTAAALQPNGSIGQTVVLTLSGTPASGTAYTVTVNTTNVVDLNGNPVSPSGNTFSFTGL